MPTFPLQTLALKYLYGNVVHYRPGDRLAPRTLSDYELVLMIEGQVTYRLNDVDHLVPPGSVILARPSFRETYTWNTQSQTRHAYFHFDIDRFPADWPPPADWPVLIEHPDPVVAPLFRHIIEMMTHHPDWPTFRPSTDACRLVESLISVLLSPIRGSQSVERQFPEPIHQALNLMREVIDEEPHRTIALKHFAKRAGVTEKHLCRLFQKTLHHAPMKTFSLLKLQLAVALLGRSNLTIKEIANRCGFDNPLYFTRCFTAAYGKPPTRVREDLAAGIPPRALLPVDLTPRVYW